MFQDIKEKDAPFLCNEGKGQREIATLKNCSSWRYISTVKDSLSVVHLKSPHQESQQQYIVMQQLQAKVSQVVFITSQSTKERLVCSDIRTYTHCL